MHVRISSRTSRSPTRLRYSFAEWSFRTFDPFPRKGPLSLNCVFFHSDIHAIVASNDTCIANSTRTINETVSTSQNLTFLCCMDTFVEEYHNGDEVLWLWHKNYVDTSCDKTKMNFCQKHVDFSELGHEAKLYVNISELTSVTSYAFSCVLSGRDPDRQLIEVNIRGEVKNLFTVYVIISSTQSLQFFRPSPRPRPLRHILPRPPPL